MHGAPLAEGLTLIANYQLSKLMEAVTYLNAFDKKPEYRISQYDRPHHAVVGVTYDLPFGRGRHFGGKASCWVDLPLGGWIVNSVYLVQSGAPLTFGNALRSTGSGSLGLNYDPRSATEATPTTTIPSFDITQFNRGSQPVNNIRTFRSQYPNLRSDGLNNWDASILKNFNFTESSFFQFRFEAFNVNNRPTYSAPNLTPTSASFGQITGTTNSPRTIQLGGRIVF